MPPPLTLSLDTVNTIPRSKVPGLIGCSVQGLRMHCTVASTGGGAITVAIFQDLLPSHVQVSS